MNGSASAPTVVLTGITKTFGDFTAVDDLSLSVSPGRIHGFLGPNGAGKTTTIRMIVGIYEPDEGSVQVLGAPNGMAVRERMGFLPEEKGLYRKMKVLDLIVYFGQLKGMATRAARERAQALLQQVGLEEWAQKPCDALSKGMGQKVQLLITLLHDPDLVILDEPFSGLDPVNVELVRGMVLDLKRAGKTVILSTHVMEQAEQICDSVSIIHKGKVVVHGALVDVKGGGRHGILLDYEGDSAVLRELKGIARLNDAGQHAELFPEEGVDPQDVLKALVGRVRIRRFDLREPSLHEIFVRAVGGEIHDA